MPPLHVNTMKSFSYVSILIELSKNKLSGYDLLLNLKKFGFNISPGTLYYQLGMLSKDGIIIGKKQVRRTLYEMTDKGQKVFKEFKDDWKDALEYVYQNLK